MSVYRIYAAFDLGVKWFLALLMAVITALTFYQVFMRYILDMAPSWSEELVRFMFVWLSFVGGAVGVKEGIHIGIDVFYTMLPERPRKVLGVLVYLVIALFGAVLAVYGWDVVAMTAGQPSPAVGIPMGYVYLAVPAMGILLILYSGVAGAVFVTGNERT